MINEKTVQQSALEAVSYSRQLVAIFARCKEDGSYGSREDYAVQKIGRPVNTICPTNWIATPVLPIYISGIFKSINSQSLADAEKSCVVTALKEVSANLEKIARPASQGHNLTSAGNIREFSGMVLPEINKYLTSIREPEVA